MTTPAQDSVEYESDPWIEAEVRRIYLEWIGFEGMPPDEVEQTITAEAARLTAMVTEMFGDSAHGPLMKPWRDKHPGQVPDYQTIRALTETGYRSAREQVLAEELYPQLDEETAQARIAEREQLQRMADQEAAREREARNPERWKTLHVVVKDELVQSIVDRVWGTGGSFEKRMLLLSLVAMHLEDDLAVPDTAAHPLAEELEELVDQELTRRAPGTAPF